MAAGQSFNFWTIIGSSESWNFLNFQILEVLEIWIFGIFGIFEFFSICFFNFFRIVQLFPLNFLEFSQFFLDNFAIFAIPRYRNREKGSMYCPPNFVIYWLSTLA